MMLIVNLVPKVVCFSICKILFFGCYSFCTASRSCTGMVYWVFGAANE